MSDPFAPYLERFGLIADGDIAQTHASQLLPVSKEGRALMLKLTEAPEEIHGGALMAAWHGAPFCAVVAQDGPALLMVRASGSPRLEAMEDAAAIAVLCGVAAGIHGAAAPKGLEPIAQRFSALTGASQEGFLSAASLTAKALLSRHAEAKPLHGDLHHGNVLMFEDGWRAIDPKGVLGPRGFDYANMFCNPTAKIGLMRFEDRLAGISEHSGLSPHEVLEWVVAWCGLSAVWSIADGQDPSGAFDIGQRALGAGMV